MSNTINTNLGVDYRVSNASAPGGLPSRQESVVTTSRINHQSIQLVGTTHELIAAGDVTDDAMAFIRNNSTTATVTVGGDASTVFVPWFDIPPGETAKMPRVDSLAATYLKSTSASTEVLVSLYKVVAPA